MCGEPWLMGICAVWLRAPQLSLFKSYPTRQCRDTAQGVLWTRAAPNMQLTRHPYSEEEFNDGHALPLPLTARR